MRYKNNIGPQVRRRRYALGLVTVDDKALLYLAEVLRVRVQVQELFPTRPPGNRIYDFIEKLETTRF